MHPDSSFLMNCRCGNSTDRKVFMGTSSAHTLISACAYARLIADQGAHVLSELRYTGTRYMVSSTKVKDV